MINHSHDEYVYLNVKPREKGCHFTDAIFGYTFLNEKVCISITDKDTLKGSSLTL